MVISPSLKLQGSLTTQSVIVLLTNYDFIWTKRATKNINVRDVNCKVRDKICQGN